MNNIVAARPVPHLHNKPGLASQFAIAFFLCIVQMQHCGDCLAANTNKPVHKASSHFLIPPPPPIIPGGSYVLDGIGAPVDFMSVAELKSQKEQLTKLVEQANKKVQDRKSDLDSVKDRATQFESLYTEGVVSKKELETATSGISGAQESATYAANDLSQLQLQLTQVNTRLARLASKSTSKKAQKSPRASR
jgi:capsule polysaccharide export protein KpsE/RkpR